MTTEMPNLPQEKPVKVKCALPDCSLLVNPPKEPGRPPMCHEHGEMFKVFVWAIPRVKFAQTPTPLPKIAVPTLVTPGGMILRGK